jgi:hypothetical protein
MSHPYSKEAKEGHSRKLKAYGGQTGKEPLTHAGFPALNNDRQAGRAPLNSEKYVPPETTPRVMRKKGGRVAGAESLKRLDKAPRKGSKAKAHPTGTRKEEVPTGTTEQVDFDLTNTFKPGEMNETSLRKRGGKVGGRQQDYEDRSHESQGAKGMRKRQAHAEGGKAMHDDDDDEMDHEDEKEDRALVKKMVKGSALTGKKDGGRAKRASGGGAFGDYMGGGEERHESKGGKKGSGKTTVNIMIGGQPQQGQPGMDPMLLAALAQAGGPGAGAPPPPPPSPPPGAAPPPAAMAAPMPPAPMGGTPQMPPGGMPMPRKDGGKVQVPYKKPSRKGEYPAMDFGSGGGFGRKQKIDAYGTKGPASKDNY